MTATMMAVAAELCDGNLVVCLEGGYSPGYMPFCCLAVVETLSGVRTEVEDVLGQNLTSLSGQDLEPHQAAVIARAVEIAEI